MVELQYFRVKAPFSSLSISLLTLFRFSLQSPTVYPIWVPYKYCRCYLPRLTRRSTPGVMHGTRGANIKRDDKPLSTSSFNIRAESYPTSRHERLASSSGLGHPRTAFHRYPRKIATTTDTEPIQLRKSTRKIFATYM